MSHETEIIKPIGVENHRWLDKFYCQWQKEHPEIETLIASGVSQFSPPHEDLAWLKEGLRLTHFGIYLAQLTFPKPSQKVSYPPVYVQDIDLIAVTRVPEKRPVEIDIGYRALLKKEDIFLDEGMAEIISTAVEEYSHWVRGFLIWTDPQREDKLRQDFDEYNDAQAELDAVRLAKAALSSVERLIYGETYAKAEYAAYSRLLATPDEFMGIIWQRKVCKSFFPWSEMTKRLQEEYDRAYQYKPSRQRGKDSSTPV